MSVVSAQEIHTPFWGSGARLWLWEGMVKDDTGEPVPCPHYADKSVMVTGANGTGGKVTIQGSNDPEASDWFTLNDPFGDALTPADGEGGALAENTYLVRPNVAAGDGDTLFDVYLLVVSGR